MKKEYIEPVARVISEDLYILDNMVSKTDLGGPVIVVPGSKPEIDPNDPDPNNPPAADAKGNGTWDMDWDF